MGIYAEKDYVAIVDEDGKSLPSVPKSWVKAGLLPPGAKPKSGRRSSGDADAAKANAEDEKKVAAEAEAKAKAEAEAKAKADADSVKK